jgi:hypothetical protein
VRASRDTPSSHPTRSTSVSVHFEAKRSEFDKFLEASHLLTFWLGTKTHHETPFELQSRYHVLPDLRKGGMSTNNTNDFQSATTKSAGLLGIIILLKSL